MNAEAIRLQITKLRNEIAFAYSDSAQGGPDHADEIKALLAQIATLKKEAESPN